MLPNDMGAFHPSAHWCWSPLPRCENSKRNSQEFSPVLLCFCRELYIHRAILSVVLWSVVDVEEPIWKKRQLTQSKCS